MGQPTQNIPPRMTDIQIKQPTVEPTRWSRFDLANSSRYNLSLRSNWLPSNLLLPSAWLRPRLKPVSILIPGRLSTIIARRSLATRISIYITLISISITRIYLYLSPLISLFAFDLLIYVKRGKSYYWSVRCSFCGLSLIPTFRVCPLSSGQAVSPLSRWRQ